MPFINDILNFKSLSIVGLEKNTGKTEVLNYILGRLQNENKKLAITSIGVDGESKDVVTHTAKPEIQIYPGVIFISAEKHYLSRRITSEIVDVTNMHTALGRLVVAKALSTDKVLLSGPADTNNLRRLISSLETKGIELMLVDGALSRLSLASPAVTEAMILTTGAAFSANLPQLVRHTQYIHNLINLPTIEPKLAQQLNKAEGSIITITQSGELHVLEVQSALMLPKIKDKLFERGSRIFVRGAVTNQLLEFLRSQKNIADIELIISDFTRIFASPDIYYSYINRGGKISVLTSTKLIAVCINPTSPQGYNLDSEKLQNALEEVLHIPVYDVKKLTSCS